MARLLEGASAQVLRHVAPLVMLGLQHEQQHQELILTDILHALSCNPLLPAYQDGDAPPLRLATATPPLKWLEIPGGTAQVGHAGEGFAFDNETPRHAVLLAPYCIADRLVTCGEYAQFISDGGYQRVQLWLSDGWAAVQAQCRRDARQVAHAQFIGRRESSGCRADRPQP
jgi:formylglycine-generating enzyme required for sulfatase activity